jgi:hypothetical protein
MLLTAKKRRAAGTRRSSTGVGRARSGLAARPSPLQTQWAAVRTVRQPIKVALHLVWAAVGFAGVTRRRRSVRRGEIAVHDARLETVGRHAVRRLPAIATSTAIAARSPSTKTPDRERRIAPRF